MKEKRKQIAIIAIIAFVVLALTMPFALRSCQQQEPQDPTTSTDVSQEPNQPGDIVTKPGEDKEPGSQTTNPDDANAEPGSEVEVPEPDPTGTGDGSTQTGGNKTSQERQETSLMAVEHNLVKIKMSQGRQEISLMEVEQQNQERQQNLAQTQKTQIHRRLLQRQTL